MAEVNPPTYIQGECYNADDDRAQWNSIVCGEGVSMQADTTALKVTAAGGMDVSVAGGYGWVYGDLNGSSGVYHVHNDAAAGLTIAANGSAFDRYDRIIASVYDSNYAGSTHTWSIEVLQGTPGLEAPLAVPDDGRVGWIDLGVVQVLSGGGLGTIYDTRSAMQLCARSLVDSVVFNASNAIWDVVALYPQARLAFFRILGAGGAGGGSQACAAGESSMGGGGGSGEYREFLLDLSELRDIDGFFNPFDGTSGGFPLQIDVGAGGAAASGTDGGAGGASAVGGVFTGTPVTAAGGSGGTTVANGTSAATATAGAGGTGGTGGDAAFPGGPGQPGLRLSGTVALGGAGGPSAFGGGGGSRSSDNNGISAAANSGAGGGGSRTSPSGSAHSGGAGGSGRVLCDLFG